MQIRKEIRDIFVSAVLQVLGETYGPVSNEDAEEIADYLADSMPEHAVGDPIPRFIVELERAAELGQVATIKKAAQSRRGRVVEGTANPEDYRGLWEAAPLTHRLIQVIGNAAKAATKRYFAQATYHFEEGQKLLATESLCSAIICSIAASATQLGWPYQDREDDHRVMIGLATGSFPTESTNIYKMLQSASQQGQDLNSAFAAAMGQPDAMRSGAYEDAGRTADDAITFAETVVKLADELGRRLR